MLHAFIWQIAPSRSFLDTPRKPINSEKIRTPQNLRHPTLATWFSLLSSPSMYYVINTWSISGICIAKWVIIYATYHLVREPGNSIDIRTHPKSYPSHWNRWNRFASHDSDVSTLSRSKFHDPWIYRESHPCCPSQWNIIGKWENMQVFALIKVSSFLCKLLQFFKVWCLSDHPSPNGEYNMCICKN